MSEEKIYELRRDATTPTKEAACELAILWLKQNQGK